MSSSIGCQGNITAEYLFAYFGLFCVVVLAFKLLIQFIESIYHFLFLRFRPPKLNQYGNWAVVTGATDGIGKAYAHQLAQRGMNVILISRNMDKLLSTASELREKYRIEVDTVQADFTEGWKLYGKLKEELNDKEIGILVNNVGTAGESPAKLASFNESSLLNMISVNIDSILIMTSIVLPQMIRRNKGAVVTVSSLTSAFVVPFVACYGATKALATAISTSLHYEYTSSGVIFQTLVPGYVNTKMISNSDVKGWFRPLIPNAETYCKSAIVTLSSSRLTTGYWLHNIFYLAAMAPKSIRLMVMEHLHDDVEKSKNE